MVEYNVIGKERKNGEYEGRSFDNMMIYTTYADGKCEGLKVETFKIKTADCPAVKLGQKVRPYYNKFGQVDYIEIL